MMFGRQTITHEYMLELGWKHDTRSGYDKVNELGYACHIGLPLPIPCKVVTGLEECELFMPNWSSNGKTLYQNEFIMKGSIKKILSVVDSCKSIRNPKRGYKI